jgi:lysophospholipase L1-like esterase
MRWRGPAATRNLVRNDGKAGVQPSRANRPNGAGSLHSGDGLHPWSRYVALGDSFTEGVGDPEPASAGGLRGWADRVAEELAVGRADFGYANLAVRGLLLQQIMDQQIGRALALQPDLVTLSAGGNDMVFHGTDPDKLAAKLEAGVSQLAQAGATIVLFTGPDWGSTLVLGRNRAKVAIFNENVRALAARHGALIADLWALTQLRDPRMWDPDRLHLSPLGHHTVAMTVLDALNVPHTLQPLEPKKLPASSWRQARASDLSWARAYFFPWVLRQLRPHAPDGELRAKRPYAGPVLPGRKHGNPASPGSSMSSVATGPASPL